MKEVVLSFPSSCRVDQLSALLSDIAPQILTECAALPRIAVTFLQQLVNAEEAKGKSSQCCAMLMQNITIDKISILIRI